MWLYEGKEFDPENLDPKELYGFVYLIENNITKRKYIGKKFFWSSKTRQVKGKKKRYKAESDWRDYYGSSAVLAEEVKVSGVDTYTRTILHLCRSKAECAYLEAREQFERNVILSDDYYNDWISVRVTRRHLAKVKERINGTSS